VHEATYWCGSIEITDSYETRGQDQAQVLEQQRQSSMRNVFYTNTLESLEHRDLARKRPAFSVA